MALACLPCAWHLWRAPTPAVWGVTAAADAGMLLLHATLAAGGGLHGMHGRSGPPMWLATALVAAQLALAGVAALRRQPAMSQRLPTTPRPAFGR